MSNNEIKLYSESPEKYYQFQNLRPDYKVAIEASMRLAVKYASNFPQIQLADLCSGMGSNSKKFSELNDNLDKVVLVDTNQKFLNDAMTLGIKAKQTETVCTDVLEMSLKKEFNLVFSIFAYHHIPDAEKTLYIQKIKDILMPSGIVILTEIYLEKENIEKYYREIYEKIPVAEKNPEIEQFINETAHSHHYEYKVTKKFADNQFAELGFKKLEEVKIWPNNNSDEGTFVQVYTMI